MKRVFWIGDSKEKLCKFPDDMQDEAGSALRKVQYGQTPDCVSSLSSLGEGISGVLEIKVDYDKEAYRVVYVAKLTKGVYVLHAFHKKSKSGIGIPPKDKELIVARYKAAREHDSS
ncbi:type II toxin-antitoxin system RelE/ParE family toxin [Solidesulfovibrio alcoholivorans]|uniref:type II toxin-antitoxin system RelE/ParE family toxin n=1 Tax=Solidesulfovibrio alcoholivorans TaxID=81406 RepID=UPI000A0094AA|nr:type II toxin-antitoxin system RelE/ParE family toxin [Solidesulfovibrio alcoholivorans]